MFLTSWLICHYAHGESIYGVSGAVLYTLLTNAAWGLDLILYAYSQHISDNSLCLVPT